MHCLDKRVACRNLDPDEILDLVESDENSSTGSETDDDRMGNEINEHSKSGYSESDLDNPDHKSKKEYHRHFYFIWGTCHLCTDKS